MRDETEFEGKILNIDIAVIRRKLNSVGASFVKNYSFKRYVFNTIPEKTNRWVRLRTDGAETTLTVKEITDDSITGTSEWEVAVDDFEKTLIILKKCGLQPKGYQENMREEYRLESAQICIDRWPMLEPYIEIEGKSESEVVDIAKKLQYTKDDLVGDNTKKLYDRIGIDLDNIKDLRF